MLVGVKWIYQHLTSVHARAGFVWRIVVSCGREIASMNHGISSFIYSWLDSAFGGLEGWTVWPPSATPTFVPVLALIGATRVERLHRERGQNDGTARTHIIVEPDGFHLSGYIVNWGLSE